MAELDTKPLPPEEEEEELETKPFLDHLEDLRWTILYSITALFVGMCIAFYGLPWIMAALEWPLRGVGEVLEEPQLIRSADLKDSAALVARFKEAADALSRYLADRLSPDTKKQVQQADPAKRPSRVLRAALVDELNRILKGECIYTPERFAQTKLSDDIHERLEQNPTGDRLIRLNRWLLEEAYPREIAKGLGPVEFDAGRFLYTIGPGEVFIFSIKLALYAGTILALPFILYFIGQFILPALTRREKRYLWPAFSIGGGLFLVGAAFCFFYVMPKALVVSIAWAKWMNLDVTFWRVGEYVAFVCGFMLGMGLAFETPVVLLSLVKMGILSHAGLRKGR
ncbi:MAG: preprotein translocase subunit TatC, partial [Verrucomicrobia bacterium]|nr:preprotein translocase subunit TatC [Verrucomicrobiota bacterium]